jgi:hypothetical protein
MSKQKFGKYYIGSLVIVPNVLLNMEARAVVAILSLI